MADENAVRACRAKIAILEARLGMQHNRSSVDSTAVDIISALLSAEQAALPYLTGEKK